MSIVFRPGTAEDSLAAFRVHHFAIIDLLQRMGLRNAGETNSAEEVAQSWSSHRGIYEHLARTAEQFWVAEEDGEIVGYSRTSNHDGVRELTEFFVLPAAQGKGVGRELLARAFPRDHARLRVIIATPETQAQVLYMRSGVYARQLLYGFVREPQQSPVTADLTFEPATASAETLDVLAQLDNSILGFRRDDDHAWLLTDRQGWIYRRRGQPVGYGYTGHAAGPFALLDPADFPVVLAHAENEAAAAGVEQLAVWAYSTNRHAIDYLLAHNFRMIRFVATLLSDVPFGQLDRYINTDPPFIL